MKYLRPDFYRQGFFMLKNFKYQIILHFIVFIWGFTAILGNYISLDSYSLVWYRMGIAFLSLFLFSFFVGRNIFRLKLRDLFFITGVGFIVGLHWITFFAAIKVSTVSIAIIAMSSSTFFMALMEPLFFKRRIRIYEIVLSVAIMGGILMIQQVSEKHLKERKENTISNIDASTNIEKLSTGLHGFFETDESKGPNIQVGLGILLALISAFLATIFTVINGKLVKRVDSFHITSWEMFGGFLLVSIVMAFMGQFDATHLGMSQNETFAVLFLAIVCTSFAFLVSTWVMKYVTPFTVAISVNMEPIYAMILAVIIYPETEKMSVEFYLGAAVIIIAVFLNAFFKSKFSSK